MLAAIPRGAPDRAEMAFVRPNPSNLIRVMPAKGRKLISATTLSCPDRIQSDGSARWSRRWTPPGRQGGTRRRCHVAPRARRRRRPPRHLAGGRSSSSSRRRSCCRRRRACSTRSSARPDLWRVHAVATLTASLIGLVAGGLVGMALALAMSFLPITRRLLLPVHGGQPGNPGLCDRAAARPLVRFRPRLEDRDDDDRDLLPGRVGLSPTACTAPIPASSTSPGSTAPAAGRW